MALIRIPALLLLLVRQTVRGGGVKRTRIGGFEEDGEGEGDGGGGGIYVVIGRAGQGKGSAGDEWARGPIQL